MKMVTHCEKKISQKKAFFLLILMVLVGITAVLLSSRNDSHHANSSFNQSASPCYVVKHAMGETCVPFNPQRILTIDSFVLGDVLALLDVKPIASMITIWEGDLSYFGQRKEGIQFISKGEGGQPNLEKALLLNPDLIIGISGYSESVYQQLSKIAPTVMLPWEEIAYNWKQRFEEVAAIFNKSEVASQYMDDYQKRIEELKKKLRNRHSQVTASILYIYMPFHLAVGLKDSFIGSILHDADLLASQHLTTGSFQTISEEILPELDSEIFFIVNLDIADQKTNMEYQAALKQRPLWSTLKSVQMDQVYLVDNDTWHGYNIFAAHAVMDDLFKYLVNTP
jgi:iron complex transport system substrate-binding protein